MSSSTTPITAALYNPNPKPNRLAVVKKTKHALITLDGITHPAATTMRASLSDSNVISIDSSSIERVEELYEHETDYSETALIYGWSDANGNIYFIALTVTQHEHLTKQEVLATNTESKLFNITYPEKSKKVATQKYYFRRPDAKDEEQWKQLENLAHKGDILFAIKHPAPVTTLPAR